MSPRHESATPGVRSSVAGGWPKSPWRKVQHEGDDYLVRENGGATWIVRLDAERATYLFEGDAMPAWARASAQQPIQGSLL